MMESQDNNFNDGSLNVDRDDAGKNAESSATRSLKSEDDKREHNIDVSKSISEMCEDAERDKSDKLAVQPEVRENGKEEDAMNFWFP